MPQHQGIRISIGIAHEAEVGRVVDADGDAAFSFGGDGGFVAGQEIFEGESRVVQEVQLNGLFGVRVVEFAEDRQVSRFLIGQVALETGPAGVFGLVADGEDVAAVDRLAVFFVGLEEGADLVVAEVPLLFEVGLETEFDSSVMVAATQDVCLDRLAESRGLSRDEGLKIWSAQIDPAEKEARADYVIHNNGTLEDLHERALALLDLLRARSRSTGEG